MPTIQAGSKVLVSGANGYIAAWCVKILLDKGYRVRGTVRSPEKGTYLAKLFASYGDKFELAIVPDITKDGAFDEAVKGVDAVEHTASPFHYDADDPNELIEPAVKGTVGMLKSVLKAGASVQRVVITSSCAAVMSNYPEPRVLSEKNWNEQSIESIQKEGKAATAIAKYRASKTLAEKAAWDFWKKNKDSVNWDIVCLNPPFVFGPAINEASSPSSLGTSSKAWYDTVMTKDNGSKGPDALKAPMSSWVDVRDIAEAHALALEKKSAGGERIIVSAGTFTWQDWIDVATTLSPNPLGNYAFSKGVPGSGKSTTHLLIYDTSKERELLGVKYKSMEETARNTLADYITKGWAKAV